MLSTATHCCTHSASVQADRFAVQDLERTLKQNPLTRELGWSPLMHAVMGGHRAHVDLLMDNGAETAGVDDQGRTALIWAAITQHDPDQGLGRLAQHTHTLNMADKAGKTALMWAAQHGYGQQVKALLDAGADPGVRDPYGRTALFSCLIDGRGAGGHALVASGADLMAQDFKGIPFWKSALHEQREDALLTWLDLGGDPHAMDGDGWSILMLACEAGLVGLVRRLLNEGADPDVSCSTGQAARDVATQETGELLDAWTQAKQWRQALIELTGSHPEEEIRRM